MRVRFQFVLQQQQVSLAFLVPLGVFLVPLGVFLVPLRVFLVFLVHQLLLNLHY